MWNKVRRWTPKIALAAAAVFLLVRLIIAAAIWVQHDWAAIRFPYPLDYGEGPTLDQAARLARLQNIYPRDLVKPPYRIANYPPLYPLLQAPFVWAFGPALWYGRLLSALGILAAALFCALILHLLTGDWLAGAAGGLLLLAYPYVVHWSTFVRVDSLALGLSMAGLYVIVRWPEQRAGLWGGAVLLAAAAYTRQSYALAAPLAAFVWLLHERPHRRAFALAGIVGGIGLLVSVLLVLVTHGGFYLHVVAANVNRFQWTTVQHYAEEMWDHIPYLLIGSGLYVLLGAWLRRCTWWLIAPYLIGSITSAITVGKVGSSVNYMFEFSAALSLAAGALIAWPGARRWWLRVPLVAFLALQADSMASWTCDDYLGRNVWKIERRDDIARMAKIVAAADGPVLADEFMGLIPEVGKPLYYQPFEFKQLAEAGLWSQWPFIDQIERQAFPVILLYDPPGWDSQGERWTNEMRAAMARHYQPVARLAETIVLRPRGQ
ncbi:MAG: hypothetical protein ACK2UX_11180 [Anaerolineae bacterium]